MLLSLLHLLPAPLCYSSFCKGLEYYLTERASQQFTSIHSKQPCDYPPLTQKQALAQRGQVTSPRVPPASDGQDEFKARMCVLGTVFAASQLSWEVSCFQGMLSQTVMFNRRIPTDQGPRGTLPNGGSQAPFPPAEREGCVPPRCPAGPPPGCLLAAGEAALAETSGKPFPSSCILNPGSFLSSF